MKRTRKSLLLTLIWVLLCFATSLLIILTQLISPVPAQEPAASIVVETTSTPPEAPPPVPIPNPESPSDETEAPKSESEEAYTADKQFDAASGLR